MANAYTGDQTGGTLRVADLAGSEPGLVALSSAVGQTLAAAMAARRPSGPLPAGPPREVLAVAAARLGPARVPERGIGSSAALSQLTTIVTEHGIDLSHPAAVAHLQPPPLTVAVAADTLASLGNASVDTYDSGPSAIAVERWVISALATLAGLDPAKAGGVLTPGGSLSNLTALQLARDTAARRHGVNSRVDGVKDLHRPVVLCSELTHFSIHRACATLGLGEAAVRTVAVDERFRMRPEALEAALAEVLADGATPIAIVATAGTTDFGSFDPLRPISGIAKRHGIWLHVDAAYGFGALFSDVLSGGLDGLAAADSITLDLHKIGWQPAAASALLVREEAAFAPLERSVDYLNPADDGDAGYGGLLGQSLQTTRRPDALKVAATLLAYGRGGLGEMVEICNQLAGHAAARIEASDRLELVAPVQLSTVVFRYLPAGRGSFAEPARIDAVNAGLRRRLLADGTALIGRTTIRRAGAAPMTCLKFTLLNPTATEADIQALLRLVLAAGEKCAAAEGFDSGVTEIDLSAGEDPRIDGSAVGSGPSVADIATVPEGKS